ncbi:hypothetical protein [Methylomonas fluvii]|uniref:Uncharacterized protein n=1 Tax=Methylomonas fluvii TaxID=1854564 RepID=A0ABR9DFM7_9GAMM|nr:hypothetical protein [Methylomonas fluvii]MBD9361750.1 hypothetical protein [Methylomonas fluvii]
MKFIKTQRNDLPGQDFEWQVIPGKLIPADKENVFDEVAVTIAGGIELRGSRCSIERALVNFTADEKLIKSNWMPTSGAFIQGIRLEFHTVPGQRILGVGVQYAVDSNVNGCEFVALLRISDVDGKRYDDQNSGQTINAMDNNAVFLGALAESEQSIEIARFDVLPKNNSNIEGFYINSLRLLVG